MRRIWRSIWFMDDDDNTPQGKLARGTFYLFYVFLGFMILFGAIVPTIDYACGGCWSEARKHGP
jgi:hypothetical protein